MNILLISYGIKEYDGRLSELYKVAKELGAVTLVCCGNKKSENPKEYIVEIRKRKYLGIRLYLSFLYTCFKAASKLRSINILLSDNLFAAIPAILIGMIFRPKSIIQDVRELYFYKDIKSKAGRFFCKYEAILMKKSDVILCANEQRSKILYERYNLTIYPIVFENIRFLTGLYDKDELDKKYKNIFKYKINIVSTGGLSVARNTDKLVNSMKKLSNEYGLFIIGDGTQEDKQKIQGIIKKNNMSNVKIINKVPLPELKYIVGQCDIGIVNYHKNDLNNKYCASGKVYEYLAEGLPIVTTENIPLKEFCVKNGVGEADDYFYNGILKVSSKIEEYKEKVNSFISGISVEEYNKKVANEILEILNSEGRYRDA